MRIYDGIVKQSSVHSASIAAGQELTLTWSTPWTGYSDTVTFKVDPRDEIVEIFENNNAREHFAFGRSLHIAVSPQVYQGMTWAMNIAGTYWFEDWVHAQVKMTHKKFHQATGSHASAGIINRFNVEKIVVSPNKIECLASSQCSYDAYWSFHHADPAAWIQEVKYTNSVAGGRTAIRLLNIDEPLIHEWGHQLGLIDNYNLNFDANYRMYNYAAPSFVYYARSMNNQMGGDYNRGFETLQSYILNHHYKKRNGFLR